MASRTARPAFFLLRHAMNSCSARAAPRWGVRIPKSGGEPGVCVWRESSQRVI